MCIKYDLDEGEKFEIKPVYSNKKYYMKYLIGYIYCFLMMSYVVVLFIDKS